MAIKKITQMSHATKIRMVNLLSGFIMIAVGALDIFLGDKGIISLSHIPSLYLVLFGLMTIAGDLNVPLVLEWCGFLGHFVYRGIFTIYCSVNLFQVSGHVASTFQPIAYIGAWIVFALGMFLVIVGTCFKDSLLAMEVGEFMATKQNKNSKNEINMSGRRDTADSDLNMAGEDLSDTSEEEDDE